MIPRLPSAGAGRRRGGALGRRAAAATAVGLVAVAAWSGAAPAAAGPPSSAVEPSTLTMPPGPGSTRGLADEASLNVQTGQVAYEIPIALPAAAAGFSPAVTLSYHGALGNGALGVGWSLGIPRLARSLRHGVPGYGDSDEIELAALAGGGRLVPVAPREYRLEGRGQAVRIVGDAGSGFVLDDGRGMRYRFGSVARCAANDRVAAWMLESVEDLAGQRATYHYEQIDGQPRLARVVWGPADAFALEIIYAPRPDVSTSLRAGFRVRTASRVRTLRVLSHGEELRAYHLAYDPGARLSRLVEVRQTGRRGLGEMPPLSFSYAAAGQPRTFALGNTENWHVGARGAVLADLDGDGVADFFQLETGRLKRNLGGTFDDEVDTTNLIASRPTDIRIFDVDGDGRPELVDGRDGGGDGWRLSRLEDGRWVSAGVWPNSRGVALVGPDTILADVNGDGLLDVVQETAGWEVIRLSTRHGLGDATRVPALPTASARLSSGRARWADVNGDGLADVVGLNGGDAQIYLGRGDGTFVDQGRFDYPWGDGYSGPLDHLLLADLDRDGIADLVVHSHGHVTWHAGLAAGGWAAEANTLASPESGDEVTLADVDGNGSLDVVWASGWAADLAGSTTAGMLVGIAGGLGAHTELRYESTARQGLAAERRGEPWHRHIAAAIPVCVAILHHTPGSPDRQTQLEVRDPAWDAQENRLAGFLSTSRRLVGDTPATTLVEATTYIEGTGDARVLRGRPLTVARRDGLGPMPLETEASRWEAVMPAALAARAGHAAPLLRMPLLREVREYTFDGASEPIEVATAHAYDGEGNATLTTRHGRTDLDGDEAVDRRRFAASETPWVRGILVATQRERADGATLARTRYAYDGGTAPLPWGQITAGRLRRVEGYLAEEGRWIVQSESDYDAMGNVVRTRLEGRERTVTYGPDGLHAVAETLATGAPTPLTWQLSWDEVAGQPTTLVGPDGAALHTHYDPLGRPIGRAHGSQSPHVEFVYDWRAPYPRTVTHLHDGAAGERTVIDVTDGAGRDLYTATAIDAGRFRVGQRRTYDARGQLRCRTRPFDVAGLRSADVGATDVPAETFAYDALGRLREQRLPNGGVRTIVYGPFEDEVRQSELAPVRHYRDGLGRTCRTERQIDGVSEVVDASYDAADRLTTLSLQGGQATQRYTYDGLGRLVASADPDGGPRVLRYDDHGWLLTSENGAGDRITYSYDLAGRVTTRSGSGETIAYHYDQPRDPRFAHTAGRLAWVQDSAGTADFGYDERGNLIDSVRVIAGEQATERADYSPAGLLLRSRTDDGVDLAFRYDPTGQVVGIGELWAAEQTSPSGGILAERYGNGITQTFTRDVLDLPTGAQVRRDEQTLLALRAHHTRFGALRKVDDRDGVGLNHSAAYVYDAGARLVHAELADFSFRYGYDALQNMVVRDVEGPRPLAGDVSGSRQFGGAPGLPGGPRQLRMAGATPIAYDGAGRVCQVGDTKVQHDAADRMTAVRRADGQAQQHTYGYDGERAMSRGAAGETRFFSATVSQRDGVREHRVRVGTRPVARVDVPRDGSPVRVVYLHATLGPGASLVTGADGAVQDERRNEPFGVPLDADFGVDAHAPSEQPRDTLTGWVDHGARWNAPALAAWLAPDPPTRAPSSAVMQSPWDLHPYQAMRQSPLLYSDPDGRNPALIFLTPAGRAAVGAAIGGTMGGGVELAKQIYGDGPVNWRAVTASAAGGAVDGAIVGAASGVGLLAEWGAVALGAATGGATTRLVNGEANTVDAIVTDAAIGVVTLGAMKVAPRVVGRIAARNMTPPKTVARVVPNNSEVVHSGTLGNPALHEVFLTDPALLEGLSAKQIARFLAIKPSPTGFVIREFSPPPGIRVPTTSSHPRFVGGGATAGGAPEWVIPNGPLPADTMEHLVR